SARADVGGSLVVASDLRLDPVALHLSLEPGMYVAFGEHHGDLRAAQFTLGDLLLVGADGAVELLECLRQIDIERVPAMLLSERPLALGVRRNDPQVRRAIAGHRALVGLPILHEEGM